MSRRGPVGQHFGRSPELIAVEEVRDYLHYLITERKVAFSTCNQKMCGILFLYVSVGRREFSLRVPAKRSGRLPERWRGARSRGCSGTRTRKERVLLMTAYGAGFGIELVQLQPLDCTWSDADPDRPRQGRKDRYTLLSPQLLEELRRTAGVSARRWLFEGAQAGST